MEQKDPILWYVRHVFYILHQSFVPCARLLFLKFFAFVAKGEDDGACIRLDFVDDLLENCHVVHVVSLRPLGLLEYQQGKSDSLLVSCYF